MSAAGVAAKPAMPAPAPPRAPVAVLTKPPPSLGNAAASRAAGGSGLVVDFGAEDVTEQVLGRLEGEPTKTATVEGRIGEIAHGSVKLKAHNGKVHSADSASWLHVAHPRFGPLAAAKPVVAFRVREGKKSNLHMSVEGAPGLTAGLLEAVNAHPEALGLMGIDLSKFPTAVTEVVDGKLKFSISGIRFRIGSLVSGDIGFGFLDSTFTLKGSGNVTIPKGQQGAATIDIERDDKGVHGAVDVAIAIGKVSGKVNAALRPDGEFEVRGTVGVRLEKFGGEVTVVVADATTAREAARAQLQGAGVQAAADEAKKPAATGKAGAKTIIGYGTLDFAVSEWLTGKAQVIIDDEGHLTVVGEIAPPAQVEFLKQRDFIRPLFKAEARAAYGLPYVGNLFLFANVGLDAMAKLGPGVLKDIKLQGTYSTDPSIAKAFSIEATLNISAFAGLRLRAEGGAGIEILGHDIKAGAGVNGIGGVRGYVQAIPKIGMREVGDPKAGKKSEFYLHGHMEIAAQPFVALSGDLFVELDSPWWSPAPDKKWTWPLGQLEYPLPGQFGIGADVDYVIGSDKFPEIKTSEVSFDPKNFMTDLMEDKVPAKSKGAEEKQGAWKEGEEPKPPDAKGGAVAKPGAPGPAAKGAGGAAKDGTSSPDPKANIPKDPATAKAFADGMKDLGQFAKDSEKHPMDRGEVDAEAAELRSRYGFKSVVVTESGEYWEFDASLNPKGKGAKAKKARRDRGDGRDDQGKFVGTSNYGAGSEDYGIRKYREATGRSVSQQQVHANHPKFPGQVRKYDGLARKGNGKYEGVEVKSGTATRTAEQRDFDNAVAPSSPATATLHGDQIEITSTRLIEVSR